MTLAWIAWPGTKRTESPGEFSGRLGRREPATLPIHSALLRRIAPRRLRTWNPRRLEFGALDPADRDRVGDGAFQVADGQSPAAGRVATTGATRFLQRCTASSTKQHESGHSSASDRYGGAGNFGILHCCHRSAGATVGRGLRSGIGSSPHAIAGRSRLAVRASTRQRSVRRAPNRTWRESRCDETRSDARRR